MKTLLLSLLALVAVALAGLVAIRIFDMRADRREWARLLSFQPAQPALFDEAMIAGLPEPAQRFFRFAIAPGTRLFRVAEIDMGGLFSLGTKEAPNYLKMEAEQVLASPEGFVWKMRTRSGMPISGSDSGSWTRFRILGLVPVARTGGSVDHARSAFGRHAAEAIFWTPAVLLPGSGVAWEAVDNETARVTLSHGGLEQAIDLTVNENGQPTKVLFMRWSDQNPDKVFRLQPFGGVLSDFRTVRGFRIPFHVEAGNHFGTGDYFPFFIADLTAVQFPEAP
ncbi:MAG: hypothetical protein KDJ43_09050 [Rhizobiaceae bacterium]|nr:hypothetical protein [Rhizobiaceae bacterium]